ncbi:MAG TPA: hypothetical protein VGC85_04075, partial [Chthoniobacterales bacterium]
MIHLSFRHLSIALGVLVLAAQVRAQEPPAALPMDEPDLVDLHVVDPTIVIDLRYATSRNIARRPLYPLNMPALVRPSVAKKLVQAQDELLTHGFRLKIWD